MSINTKIAEHRRTHSAADHRAWCTLWVRAAREDLRVQRTAQDTERLYTQIAELIASAQESGT